MSDGMKPSGVSWIGEIPEDWRVEPLKFHCVMFKGLPIQKTDLTDDGRRVVSYGQVHSKLNSGTHLSDDLIRYVAPALAPVSASSRLRRGDLVFADTSEDLEGIGNAVYVDSDDLVFAGYHTVTCRPDRMIDGRYFAYLARVECWRGQLRSYAMGVKVYSITQSVLSKVSVILPPVEEQGRIAAYLDAQTAGIDAAVADIERQLDVLERYKASVIHEAVTKGLDADAPMKPSGIEWIGDIPAHWQAERVAYHCELESGHTPSTLRPEWWKPEECVIPWVTTADIHRFRDGRITVIDDTEEHVSQIGLNHSSARILPAGTVALSRTASVGFSIIMGTDMASSQDFADWVPDATVSSEYLLYVFRSMTQVFDRLKMGSTHKTIYMHVLKTLKMPLPPVEEQKRIAAYLDAKCAAIDSIIATKRRQAAILKARRQSLIYEYVTGKRRVPMEE